MGMDIFYNCLDYFYILSESLLIMAAVVNMSGKRFKGKKHILLLLVLSLACALVAEALSLWQSYIFNVLFPIAATALFVIPCSKLISTGGLLTRSTSFALALFFIYVIDFVLEGFGAAILSAGEPDLYSGYLIMQRDGIPRTVCILASRAVEAAALFLFKPLYPKLREIGKRNQILLLAVTCVAYFTSVVISRFITSSSVYLIQLLIDDTLIIFQTVVIVAMFLILLCVIVFAVSLTLNERYQSKLRESEMMKLANSLMEENYRSLHQNQTRISQQVHDFTNHLRAIDGMLEENSTAKEYIGELLSLSYKRARQCRSGNDIIDSIINCKAEEAALYGIQFTYKVSLISPLKIAPTDICAVLANQIDNAIEACRKIPEERERAVTVDIHRREAFIFFTVKNSTEGDPFDAEHRLISTKKDGGLHGLGIKNIEDAVSRYEGSLKNEFKGNTFTSAAMMQNPDK